MVALQGVAFRFRDDGGQLHGDRAWSMQPPCSQSDEMWLELAKGMGYWKQGGVVSLVWWVRAGWLVASSQGETSGLSLQLPLGLTVQGRTWQLEPRMTCPLTMDVGGKRTHPAASPCCSCLSGWPPGT